MSALSSISQDVYNMVCTLHDNINECDEFGDASRLELTRRIIEFSKSYHAKECARCMTDLDDIDRADFARFEKRSGITTDVDWANMPDAENQPYPDSDDVSNREA